MTMQEFSSLLYSGAVIICKNIDEKRAATKICEKIGVNVHPIIKKEFAGQTGVFDGQFPNLFYSHQLNALLDCNSKFAHRNNKPTIFYHEIKELIEESFENLEKLDERSKDEFLADFFTMIGCKTAFPKP